MKRHTFKVDYSDGRFSLREARFPGAPIELSDKELARLERHFAEDRYWQERFRVADNEFVEGGKTWCERCQEFVSLEDDPRGWPFCPTCKGA